MGLDFESLVNIFNKSKPWLGVILLQLLAAGNAIISKYALNKGIHSYILVVYRNAFATLAISPFALVLDRKTRPKMTLPIFIKIQLIALLETTIDQNMYYAGLMYTSATYSTAIYNVLPAFTFIMAWIFRLEKVDLKSIRSVGKILGTVVTIGGAMLMTLVTGPELPLPWTHDANIGGNSSANVKHDYVKGALLLSIGCLCRSAFVILHAITLKAYPTSLSLTALICGTGTLEGAIFAMAIEKGNMAIWSIPFGSQLLAAVYGGVVACAMGYYVQGMVMRAKGPVFLTVFGPVRLVLVAIISSLVLAEILYLGRVIGAIVIVIGLYLVLWGKKNDRASSEKTMINNTVKDQEEVVE